MRTILAKGSFLLLFMISIWSYFALYSCKSQKSENVKESEPVDVQKELNQNLTVDATQSTPKFGFETGTEGWIYQTWVDSRGIIRVEQTEAHSKSGRFSLHLDCDLQGNSKTNTKGEAFVDLRATPPEGVTVPVNLKGKKIRCWILIPSDRAGGDPHRPNGIQLFVKSVKNEGTPNEQWLAQYGTWYNLPGRTGSWFEITLKPSTETPKWGYTDLGFDPTQIIVIGVKIGIGTGSSASFRGSLFIDDIDW